MRAASDVKVTQNGVVGDSCMFSNIGHLLHGNPSTWSRMSATPATLASAMSSREIIRSAACPTLRLGGLLIGPSYGCDHSTLLPPYFPVFRSSDTSFSSLLSLAYPTHATADVPLLVTHRSLPDRRYSNRGVSEPWRCGVGEAIRGLMFAETPSAYRSVSNPLRSLGERMVRFGSLPADEFAAVVRILVDEMIERKIRRLEWLLESAGAGYPYYASAIEAALRTLAESTHDPLRFTPTELIAGVSPDQAMARLQRLAHRFGEVLQAWMDINTATRQLAAGGVTVSTPV
jgi:hypothetical protein